MALPPTPCLQRAKTRCAVRASHDKADAWLGKLYAAGVPITLASDAHLPGDVGLGVDRCLGAASAVGYTSLARFRGREWQAVPLG